MSQQFIHPLCHGKPKKQEFSGYPNNSEALNKKLLDAIDVEQLGNSFTGARVSATRPGEGQAGPLGFGG
jgi:hypothetical protein